MSGADPERFRRVVVEVPIYEGLAIKEDRSGIYRATYVIGVALLILASAALMLICPDPEASIYIFIASIFITAPLIVLHASDTLYGRDWLRMMIECETPYFLASLKFLLRNGFGMVDAVKELLRRRHFPFISSTLSGFEAVTSKEELKALINKSRSPFLRRAIRDIMVKPDLLEKLVDESYRVVADYGIEYLKILNRTYKTVFYLMGMVVVIPTLLPIYHAFVYTELGGEYVASWIHASSTYLALILAGLFVILLSTTLMYKPRIIPIAPLDLGRLTSFSISRRDIAFISIIALSFIPSILSPQAIPLTIAIIIFATYSRCSTISEVRRIPDVVNDFAYLLKQSGLDGAVSGIASRSYGGYLDERIRVMALRYSRTGDVDIDEENLRPFLRTLYTVAKLRGDIQGLDEYVVDMSSLLAIPRYVEGQFKAVNPKPYLGYIVVLLAFTPLMYASSYTLGFISIPIFAILSMMRSLNVFPYQTGNISGFSWSSFWGEQSSIPTFSMPPLSNDVYSAISVITTTAILFIAILEGITRRDYKPVNIVIYTGGVVAMNMAVMIFAGILSTLIPIGF